MRKLVAALVLLGCISFIAVAADRTDALKKADQDWAKSAQARNIDQFMGFLGDDAYMCGTDGNWGHGKDSLKAEWAKLLSDPAFKINWTVDTAEVRHVVLHAEFGVAALKRRGRRRGSPRGAPFSTPNSAWPH